MTGFSWLRRNTARSSTLQRGEGGGGAGGSKGQVNAQL